MVDETWVLEQFEASRPRLRGVAYRMLGSRTEAEDAVQDTWLRLSRTDPDGIDNLGGWLTTVLARVCLDRLRSRTARREAGDIDDLEQVAEGDDHNPDPAEQAVLADSVGAALLVVLDALGPAERVAFVLHDVFAVPFDDIAEIVGRTPEATRQLASRARRRVQGSSPMTDVDLVQHREVVDAFLRAAQGGDFDTLVQLLAPDVVLRPDAAALAMGSLTETSGAMEVATMLAGGAQAGRRAVVDGLASIAWAPGGRVRGFVEFTIVDGRITALDVTGDADRIGRAEIVLLDA
jgi:RNA polymerase sigma-70 factor (ECF subfamily)